MIVKRIYRDTCIEIHVRMSIYVDIYRDVYGIVAICIGIIIYPCMVGLDTEPVLACVYKVSPQARHNGNSTLQLAFCTSSPLLSILVLMGSAHPP